MSEIIRWHENVWTEIAKMWRIWVNSRIETFWLLSKTKEKVSRVTWGTVKESYGAVNYYEKDKIEAAERMWENEENTIEFHQHPNWLRPSPEDIKTRTNEFNEKGKDSFMIFQKHPHKDTYIQVYFDHSWRIKKQRVKWELCDVSEIWEDRITRPFCSVNNMEELQNIEWLIQKSLIEELMR